MQILDDLISTLDDSATVRDVRQGPFQTAVLTRNCGLAATPHHSHDHDPAKAPVLETGHLTGKNAIEVARMAYSQHQHEAAIGMAAINSLLNIDDERCVELNAGNLLAKKSDGRKVAIVGHFPFTQELRQTAKELWVIEMRPREGDLPASETERVIPQADVVGITGTAFTNHTIERLLLLCRPEAFVVVLGGTTPLSPVLFKYGVDAVSGTQVIDPNSVLACVSRGATFREIRGIRLLTMLKETNADDVDSGSTWSVQRQDDNGNVSQIGSGLTKAEARRLAAEYEAKGHKQTYWVQKKR